MQHLRASVVLLAVFTLLCGGAYPGIVTLVAQALFPAQAQGSLIVKDGHVLGSELIGQNFTDPKYFWSRLSATGPFVYNAASSTGSNMSPANPALLDAVKGRVDALKKADPTNSQPIPVDLVTASASGLDPDISLAAAEYQAARVAAARSMSQERVEEYIRRYTQLRPLGFLGEPTVNVLMLNLALDGRL